MADTFQPLPPVLQLMAHELRWQLLQALSVSDRKVYELVALVNAPMNLVSYHLKKLRVEQIVSVRRSEADGRDMYYTLDLERLRSLFTAAGGAVHPLLGNPHWLQAEQPVWPSGLRVLFVCTHNSARSQMAEGLLRHLSDGHIAVMSAGSHPGSVHGDAVATLHDMEIDIRAQQAKSISAFAGQSFDYVITVCDHVREVCPTFPGGQQLHWGLLDPAIIEDEARRVRAFRDTAQGLQSRITHFLYGLQATHQPGS